MKITFDTKEETSESLQLVIQFLNGLQKIQKPNILRLCSAPQSSPFHSNQALLG